MTEDERVQYYARATTWAEGYQQAAAGRARIFRTTAIILAVVAVLEAFALIALTPLKTVTPLPVLVDRQTGFVEVLRADGTKTLTANEALTQSLLSQYVVARESYNITSLAADYHKVALWSAGSASADYLALMPASNPASPLRLYPRTTLVETLVKSVSPLGPGAALVRFETRRRDQDVRAVTPQEWAAVIAYRYVDEPLTVSDRWLNPLGFQVIRYHKDAEAPLPPEATAPDGESPSNATANNTTQGPVAALPTANPAPVASPDIRSTSARRRP